MSSAPIFLTLMTSTLTSSLTRPSPFRCVTWNVRGLHPGQPGRATSGQHAARVIQQLKSLDAHILCLQETHLYRHQEAAVSRVFGQRYRLFFSSCAADLSRANLPPEAPAGVVIAVRQPCEVDVLHHNDDAGRVCGVRATLHGASINVWCVYGPSAGWHERLTFWRDLAPWHHLSALPLTLTGGDFNVLTRPRDRSDNVLPQAAASTADAFLQHMQEGSLTDMWSAVHPDRPGFTYTRVIRSPLDAALHARLDRWLLNTACVSHVQDISVVPTAHSDHSPLQIDLHLPTVQLGPGFWRGSAPAYRFAHDAIEGALALHRALPERWLNPAGWWADLKGELRRIVRLAGRQRAQQLRQDYQLAQDAFAAVQERLEAAPPWIPGAPPEPGLPELLHEWQMRRQELEQQEEALLAKLRLRGGARNLRDFQRPTKAFFARVADRQRKALTPGLRGLDGIVHHQREAANTAAKFYASLYAHTPTQEQARDVLHRYVTARVSAEDSRLLAAPLSELELQRAANLMSADKAPGLDGHTLCLYQRHPSLCSDLLHVWQDAMQVGRLPYCSRVSAMVLLRKKGMADQLDPAEYRPISLTPTDYRIISKAFSLRLRDVLPSLLGEEQTGSVPQRDIRDNLLLQRLTHTLCRRLQIPVTIMSVDIRKAFDSTSREGLWHTMAHFGFPSEFIHAMQVLHADSAAVVNVNGFISERFPVDRGVRQGCPLAMLLFVLALEPLLCALRAQLRGVTIRGHRATLAAFADDLLVMLGCARDAHAFGVIFRIFTEGWSLQMNPRKTTFYQLAGATWSVPGTQMVDADAGDTFLGVPIGPQQDDPAWLRDKVVPAITRRIAAKCALWRAESLAIQQRCLAAQLSIASHALYPMFVLPTTALDLAGWQARINRVVEHVSPRLRIGIRVLQQPLDLGGQQLPDLARTATAVKAQTVLRALRQPHKPWAGLFLLLACGWLGQQPSPSAFFTVQPSRHQREQWNAADLVSQCLAAFSLLQRRVLTHPELLIAGTWTGEWQAVSVRDISRSILQRPPPVISVSADSLLAPPTSGRPLPAWSTRWPIYANLPGLPAMARDFLYRFLQGKTAIGYLKSQPDRRCNCPYCPGEVETITHVFLDCPVTVEAVREATRALSAFAPDTDAFLQAWRTNWIVSYRPHSTQFNCVMLVTCVLRYTVYRTRCRVLYDGDRRPTGRGLWLAAWASVRHVLHSVAHLADAPTCRKLSLNGRWLQPYQRRWRCLL